MDACDHFVAWRTKGGMRNMTPRTVLKECESVSWNPFYFYAISSGVVSVSASLQIPSQFRYWHTHESNRMTRTIHPACEVPHPAAPPANGVSPSPAFFFSFLSAITPACPRLLSSISQSSLPSSYRLMTSAHPCSLAGLVHAFLICLPAYLPDR
jgi:hypothetical protein